MRTTRLFKSLAPLLAGLLVLTSHASVASESNQVEPSNDLENHLLAVQQGRIKVASFFEELVNSEVVVLSKRDVLDQRSPEDISALVLPAEDGQPRMLAVFTSARLAARVAKTYPEYRFGINTEFVWLLAHTSPGLGLAINPGWTMGMRIPSYGVLQMRERYEHLINEQYK